MPRQPFKLAAPKDAQYYISWDCLSERPELAARIGRCVATWSQVEVGLSLILAALLDTRSEAAVAVFLSLQNARAQREALVSAAQLSLTGEDLAIFEAVMAFHKAASGDRNDLAHGIFGVIGNHPDLLVWAPSAKFARWLTGANKKAWRLERDIDPHAGLREEMFVYRPADLEEIQTAFTELFRAVSNLHMLIAPIPNLDKDRPREELCSSPRIRAILDREGHGNIR